VIIEQALPENFIAATGSALHAPEFAITFKPDQLQAIDVLVAKFSAAPWNTPLPKDAEHLVGPDVLSALIDLGRLIKLSEEVLLLAETYRSGVEQIRAYLIEHRTITVAQVRDLFNTSRKYALALMEHLDAQGITKRAGDERILR
jgi:selenocysteine-specific elongation factor